METEKTSGGAPILKEIWDQFATYDTNAVREQVKFKRVQNSILVLGVVAVLLALFQAQLFGVDEPDPFSLWYEALRWGIIIAPILIAALIAISNQFKSGNKWIMLRSGAESLKREIFRYRAQAGIYGDEATQEKTREQKLADKLTKIRRQVMKTAVSEASLKPHGETMPSDMGFLNSSQYIDSRLKEQRTWYMGKTSGLETKLRALQVLTILIGGLGTLLAAIGFELWVALTTALAAAFATYLEYTRTENTLVLYNQVATDLTNILTWWAALNPGEEDLPSNHNLLVQQTEKALETEHSGWVQNMTEALAELQEQQEATVEQVKAQVESVRQEAAAQETRIQTARDADADEALPELQEGIFDDEALEAAPEIAPPAPARALVDVPIPAPVSRTLTEDDLIDEADELGIELAAMKAVAEVEAGGSGFKGDKPKILFEGHIFWRRLKAHGIDPAPLVAGNENVLHKKWTRRYYREDQYARLDKAKQINEDAALESASWGMFQIMGYHWESLGYDNAKEFVDLMYQNEGEHLKAFAKFLETNNLVRHLKNLDWAKFARGYNGPGYAENKYDTKMADAYKKYKQLG